MAKSILEVDIMSKNTLHITSLLKFLIKFKVVDLMRSCCANYSNCFVEQYLFKSRMYLKPFTS